MLKKLILIGKGITASLVTSLFFCSFFIMFIYFTLNDKITTYVNIINQLAITEKQTDEKEIKFDSVGKSLIKYPAYGTVWATLKIPDIEVEAPVYHGDTLDIIKYGVGHYSGSYFPGEGGSIILAAHNSKQHFMYLPKLKEGSKVIIEAVYGTFTYQVTSTKIIKDTDKESLPIKKDKEMLMMYTCYPVNTIGHKDKRYVVYLELVDDKYES